MTTINYETAPSLTFDAFEAPHGAKLPYPLILLDVDALPAPYRIDKSASFFADLDWSRSPLGSGAFVGAWRACTPGSSIVVAASVTCPEATVYVESSANGTALLHACAAGNLSAYTLAGFRFSTTQPFYRIVVALSAPGRGSVWTQQRA